MTQILTGFLLSTAIALLAWKAGSLSGNGAWAAFVIGGLIFGLGGLPWAVLLLAFFISSSALSRAFKTRKFELAEKFSKGSRRDWAQVLANGGLGALLVVGHEFFPHTDWQWLAYAGAIAAVNADTWATELGILSPTAPRLITTGKIVERGTSGGITMQGTLAALGGALVIGLCAAFFTPSIGFLPMVSAVTMAGLAGAMIDSILGATVQAIYICPKCQKETEKSPLHGCGTPTIQVRGWKWMNNDAVNLICSVGGAITALGIEAVFL